MYAAILWSLVFLTSVLLAFALKRRGKQVEVKQIFQALGATVFVGLGIGWSVLLYQTWTGVWRLLFMALSGALTLLFLIAALLIWLELLGFLGKDAGE